MKKILVAILLSLLIATPLYAAGTASVSNAQRIAVMGGQPSRIILTISWTDDTAGTTLEINPATYGIQGWYLYSAETNPGSTAPTDNYDITLVDADGTDLAGSTLLNRDETNSELVNVGTASHGYPIIRSVFTFTLSGNSVNNATGTCILTFVAN